MGKGALRIALQEGLGKMPDLTCNGQRSLADGKWREFGRTAPAGPEGILGCFVIYRDLSSRAVAQTPPQVIEE